MKNFNLFLFKKINGLSGQNKWLDAFGRAGAEWAIVVAFFWFLTTSLIHYSNFGLLKLIPVIFFVFIWLISWGISLLIGFIIKKPRPQVSSPEQTKEIIKPLSNWKSFPSDHTMSVFLLFFFSVIFSLPGSLALLILALWVSFSRIFVGVHYPVDILGGFFLSLMMASWTLFLLSYLN